MPPRRDLHEQNRRTWNLATRAHNSHKGDQAAFLRAGGTTLFPEEVELLGNVQGRELVHLQCNSGQDTLSLAARHGARVTGVDISDEAIAFATRLADQAQIPATFIRSDVYDWFEAAPAASYDVAFASYGWLGWLSDLEAYAHGVARVLRPGGLFAAVEFHPLGVMFDEDFRLADPYTTHGLPLSGTGVTDYVAESGAALVPWGYQEGVTGFTNPEPDHGFAWGAADLVMALLNAGFALEALHEYPYANGCRLFRGMRCEDGRWFPPATVPMLPLMLGLHARRNHVLAT